MTWRYAVVAQGGERVQLSPEEAQPGREHTYPVSDELYASLYDHFKEKYESPLVTTDGISNYIVWLYRYESSDPSGIYPIVWRNVHTGSESTRGEIFDRPTPIGNEGPAGLTLGRTSAVSPSDQIDRPTTITFTGTRQTPDVAPTIGAMAPTATWSGLKMGIAAMAIIGVAWAAGAFK